MASNIDRKAIIEMGERLGYEGAELAAFLKETVAEIKLEEEQRRQEEAQERAVRK